MRFGRDLPLWLNRLGQRVGEAPDTLPTKMAARSPVFDQAIINWYKIGQGIKHHVDLARYARHTSQSRCGVAGHADVDIVTDTATAWFRFEDGIASLSFRAPVVFSTLLLHHWRRRGWVLWC